MSLRATLLYRPSAQMFCNSVRLTSAGPPPAKPSAPGSLSDRYDKFIGRWPKVQAVHRMVVDGSRWCFSDIKTYFKVRRALKEGKKLHELSLPELEVLVQTPAEGPKLAVVLTLLPLPFTVYVIGFAIIFFPRLVLTRHFWTDQQRKEFFLKDVEKSMERAESAKKPLIETSASSIESAPFDSVMAISRLHGILPIPLPNLHGRLSSRAASLKELDEILSSKLDSLTSQQLYFHMYIRRLTYQNLSDDEIRGRLRNWLQFASNLTGLGYLQAPYHFNQRQ